MNSLIFGNNPRITILIKDSYLIQKDIQEFYIKPLQESVMVFGLPYNSNNKVTIKQAREYLIKLLPYLVKQGIDTLYVADSTYFKAITKETKAETNIGYIKKCAIDNYDYIDVIYGVNYGQCLYNDSNGAKLELTLQTLKQHITGTYSLLGNIDYVVDYSDSQLETLLNKPALAIDIETTGLDVNAQILTIAFADSKNTGIAFAVNQDNKPRLKRFFEKYQGRKIFHNATFDTKIIIKQIFMSDNNDYIGLLHGLHTMHRKLHDTKVIAYLATNNTQGNNLGLKELAYNYMGNYAVDVSDCTKVPMDTLLEYNFKDTIATYYVYEHFYPLMVQDNQLAIYEAMFLPTLKTITHIELIGLPVNRDTAIKTNKTLQQLNKQYINIIMQCEYIDKAIQLLKEQELIKYNNTHKKPKTIDDITVEFNINSNQHLSILLYEVMQLPILAYTDTKQPSVDSKTLTKLKSHTDEPIIQDLLNYFGLQKVLSAFMPLFVNATPKDGWHYIYGNFNATGTVSGRLSSSKPNLQQLPSGRTYGKAIKSCVQAPKGWIFVGADFSSLEARINALLTKDPNKLKVYTDGLDSHSFNAYSFWKNKMPDITDTVDSINSIKDKYPKYRQQAKAPVFALQYQGTYKTLMSNCGFSEIEAKEIENNYHSTYQVSNDWLQARIKQILQDGYTIGAFGLKVRCPVLSKSILASKKTPYKALAEARTAGNLLSGQSYCLLNNRAVNAFMERVYASEYKYDIKPVCLIHDASYFLIRNNVNVVKWVNDNLIDCMAWQELDEIKHDTVGLEAELDLYYPSWANAITLPNYISKEQIKQIVRNQTNK